MSLPELPMLFAAVESHPMVCVHSATADYIDTPVTSRDELTHNTVIR